MRCIGASTRAGGRIAAPLRLRSAGRVSSLTPLSRGRLSEGLVPPPQAKASCSVGSDDGPTAPLQAALTRLWTAASRAGSSALAAAVAASIVMAPFPSAASADVMVRLPASTDPAVFLAQRTMVEAWTIVGETFVDESFNGHDWVEELRDRMLAAYYASAPEEAWGQLAALLEDLGDPYTRRISPREYESFRVSADGELQGVGLLIASEPVNGHLLVLAPIEGGPADRAGVLPGDEVISIDGQSMYGWDAQRAATVLRGGGGTEVQVKLIRRTEQIPGVPGRPEPMPRLEYKEVRLRRERVQISPVYAALLAPPPAPPASASPLGPTPVTKVAALPAPELAVSSPSPSSPAAAAKRASHAAAVSLPSLSIHLPSFPLPWATPSAPAPEGPSGQQQEGGPAGQQQQRQQQPGGVGYLRLTQFSGNAAQDLAKAITRLEADGARSLILDLRNNPGGLVTAGLEVAHLLLDGQPVVFNVSAREGEVSSQTTEDSGPALTHLPLAVLVDGNSASASEILSGALRDYGRAVVIGDANTYGKGKIQSVFELQDGSALFVTVAKYQTPNGTEIDKRGIRPDLSCSPASLATAAADAGAAAQMEAMAAAAAAGASNFQPGLPVGPGSAEVLAAQLMEDRCVITARQVLSSPSVLAAALRGEALGASTAPSAELAAMSASLPTPVAAPDAPAAAVAAPGQQQGEQQGSGALQSAELSVL